MTSIGWKYRCLRSMCVTVILLFLVMKTKNCTMITSSHQAHCRQVFQRLRLMGSIIGMADWCPIRRPMKSCHEDNLKQLIFQVDLWNAKGTVPENMMEIDERIKDIQYSSKTRMVTDFMAQNCVIRALSKSYSKSSMIIPKLIKLKNCASIKPAKWRKSVSKRDSSDLSQKTYERGYKDYEFSGLRPCKEHWESGLQDIENTFRHPDWFMLPETDDIFVSHDIHQKRKRLAQVSTLLKILKTSRRSTLNALQKVKKKVMVASHHFFMKITPNLISLKLNNRSIALAACAISVTNAMRTWFCQRYRCCFGMGRITR